MKFQQRCFLLTTLLCIGLLTACSSSGKKWNPDDYTVKSGDTVYSIAWRYELDPEEFADWNNLGQSKLIKPGQRLHTRQPAGFSSSTEQSSTSRDIAYGNDADGSLASNEDYSQLTKIRVSKGDTLYGISAKYGVSVKQLVQLNQLKKPYVIQPGQTIFLQPIKTASNTTSRTTQTRKPASSTKTQQTSAQTTSWPSSVRWRRPANGKLVKKFDRRRNDAKGIDIAGKQGDAIVAAADGKVVYSGNGLISYGNLVIIKHNKTYLSAYAYNRKLLVNEGDQVKSGQKIAEMGQMDTSSPRLHFEIRKNGKPVDPLKYLSW